MPSMKAFLLLLSLLSGASALRCTKIQLSARERASFIYYPNSKFVTTTALQSSLDNEGRGLKLSMLPVLFLGVFGVFGFGLLDPIKEIGKEISKSEGSAKLKQGTTDEDRNRGALTKLTTREINFKLRQVPVFYVVGAEGTGLYVEDGKGFLFLDNADADAFASKNKLSVKSSTLDDFWFTLINKKTKIGKYMENVVGDSDPAAEYVLVPSKAEITAAGADWQSSHSAADAPLFRVANLAFNKENGLEIPLFISKTDALSTYKRLYDARKDGSNLEEAPSVQVLSFAELVQLWRAGGFEEARSLEIYPRVEAIEAYSTSAK